MIRIVVIVVMLLMHVDSLFAETGELEQLFEQKSLAIIAREILADNLYERAVCVELSGDYSGAYRNLMYAYNVNPYNEKIYKKLKIIQRQLDYFRADIKKIIQSDMANNRSERSIASMNILTNID